MKRLTLEGFLQELTSVKARTPIMLSVAAQSIGEVVQAKSTDIVGTYQRDDMGEFEPWAELADETKKDRVNHGYTENDPGLRSGKMKESIEFSVNGTNVEVGSNDEHIAYFEYGTERQPPRSVIGLGAHRSKKEIDEINKLTVTRILS